MKLRRLRSENIVKILNEANVAQEGNYFRNVSKINNILYYIYDGKVNTQEIINFLREQRVNDEFERLASIELPS